MVGSTDGLSVVGESGVGDNDGSDVLGLIVGFVVGLVVGTTVG